MTSTHDQAGARKYLTETERARFPAGASRREGEAPAFCHTLGWSGCRISERLALLRSGSTSTPGH